MSVLKVIGISAATVVALLAALALAMHFIGPRGFDAHRGGWHGHARGGGDPCARLDADHVERHLAGASGWITGELDLDAGQRDGLEPFVAIARDWSAEVRALCPIPHDDARSLVAVAARIAAATAQAAERLDASFAAFYDALTPAQRTIVDGWVRHGAHHRRRGGWES